jgi:nucleoside-diphosphate-sugar epimerase
MTIGFLGATSQIAKGLIAQILGETEHALMLFARREQPVRDFLAAFGRSDAVQVVTYESLPSCACDILINCVGISDARKQRELGYELFAIAEKYDAIALDYIIRRPETLLIGISSGAVYGTRFPVPASDDLLLTLNVNGLVAADYYGISKLYAEARHRALARRIIDLRVFSYFSEYTDLSASFLLSQLVNCVKRQKEFVTNRGNIMRDYIHPADLWRAIELCASAPQLNTAFDVFSRAPVSKMELLAYFEREWGLRVVYDESADVVSTTGSKDNYYSLSRRIEAVGYAPRYSSLENIDEVCAKLLSEAIRRG